MSIDSCDSGFSGGRVHRIRLAATPISFALKVSPEGQSVARWHEVAGELAKAMAEPPDAWSDVPDLDDVPNRIRLDAPVSTDISSTHLDAANVGRDSPRPLNSGLLAAPIPTADGRWIVSEQGRHWQCTAWVDGKACDDSEAIDALTGPRALVLGGEAIARLHARLSTLPAPVACSGELPRCFRDRLQRLQELRPWLSSGSLLRERLPSTTAQWCALLERCVLDRGGDSFCLQRNQSGYQKLAQRMMSATERMVSQGDTIHRLLTSELQQHLQTAPAAWRQAWVLRDIHREHILFDTSRERVTGIIDHDAMDWDCPVVDLVRWAGSFPVQLEQQSATTRLGWAVEGYNRIASANHEQGLADGPRARSFFVKSPTPEELALGETLLRLNAWVGMANWVDWIGLRRRVFFSSPEALSNRISGLIDSVCHFC
ncbi:MAG: phosphotransferase [Rhodopirellula sp. JB055]|uniref:phosphotransferase n=1 Tax=Rhodopirellula sp. JB055 TaxID=3342846 RepID=UPI00370C6FF2